MEKEAMVWKLATVSMSPAGMRSDIFAYCCQSKRLALVFLAGLSALIISACATPFGSSPEIFKKADPGPLTLIARYPEANATGIPTNVAILLRFNRNLDPASVSDASIAIAGLPGRVRVDGSSISFLPSMPFRKNSTYTITLAPTLRDTAGGQWTPPEIWRFTTGSEPIAAPAAMRVPTPSGKTGLCRYPYLQTDSPRRMKILWATTSPGQGLVQYQAGHEQLWRVVPATSQHYDGARTQLDREFYQHEALLEDLTPGTHYRYNVLHNDTVLADGVPLKALEDGKDASVRFIVFGDSGTEHETPRAVRDAIASRDARGLPNYPHDFIVGVGDIAYYNGSYVEFDQRFFDQLSAKGDRGDGQYSILVSRPFFPVLGNHEYAQKENSIPEGFLQSFSNPVPDDIQPGNEERYYSFDSGDAHFVVIDSMKFRGQPTAALDAMLAWLERDLTRTMKKWRVVFYHHAIYTHGPHGTYGDIGLNRRMRQRLAPIMQKYGVQLAINGHDHLYERSKRFRVDRHGSILRDRKCRVLESDKGIVYLTVGIGGYELYKRDIEPAPCGSPAYAYAMRQYGEGYDFVATRSGQPIIYDATDREPRLPLLRHGFAHVTAGPEVMRVVVYNHEGGVLDDFELR